MDENTLMKTYTIKQYGEDIPWESVSSISINDYPWYVQGKKQETYVKLVMTTEHLIIKVIASDVHSSATVLDRNGSVHLDSCFEFFFTPIEELSTSYINLEINCIGTLYMAMRDATRKVRISEVDMEHITIKTSLEKGKIKYPKSDDTQWSLEILIPFTFIETFFGSPISKTIWHANFYRCGGSEEPQYAVWNPVKTQIPDFHQPLQFGELHFDTEK